MHLVKASFHGNPNIGLYVYATDNYCLAGPDVPYKVLEEIAAALKVKPYVLTLAGTSLFGVFCAGNNSCLLVPSIAFESELQKLTNFGIRHKVIDTEFTALGNNLLIGREGLANPEMDDAAIGEIGKALGIRMRKASIAGVETPGAVVVMNRKGCLVHPDASDEELLLIRKLLGVQATMGTANFGNPYLRSALIVNDSGLVVGEQSTGIEIAEADRAFGFI